VNRSIGENYVNISNFLKALLRHVFFFFFFVVCLIKLKYLLVSINGASMVIKPLNVVSYPGYEETSISPLVCILSLKNLCIFYLGIPFSSDLSLEPVITYMNTKVKKSLIFFL